MIGKKLELQEVSKMYQDNFKMLLKIMGTPEHDHYVAIERKLHRREIALLKQTHQNLEDPCPIKSKYPCGNCTGYYKELLMCKEDKPGAMQCVYKKNNDKLTNMFNKLFK